MVFNVFISIIHVINTYISIRIYKNIFTIFHTSIFYICYYIRCILGNKIRRKIRTEQSVKKKRRRKRQEEREEKLNTATSSWKIANFRYGYQSCIWFHFLLCSWSLSFVSAINRSMDSWYFKYFLKLMKFGQFFSYLHLKMKYFATIKVQFITVA